MQLPVGGSSGKEICNLTTDGRSRHDDVRLARSISGLDRILVVTDDPQTGTTRSLTGTTSGSTAGVGGHSSASIAELGRVLRSRARALGADTHEADDLAQQSIANVLAHAPEKVGHAGYAIRTLTRLWLDRQRSLRARGRRLRSLALGAGTGHHRDAPRDESRGRAVQEAIERLPPKQRAALMLRVVEGLGYGAIAEAIGCSEDAARASLHQARARLRRELMQRGIEP